MYNLEHLPITYLNPGNALSQHIIIKFYGCVYEVFLLFVSPRRLHDLDELCNENLLYFFQ